jgi:DNA repair ATPase RecN
MTSHKPDPEQLAYIREAWKAYLLPGERLETVEDLDRLQTRVKALLQEKSERLEKQLTNLTGAVKTLIAQQQRLNEASKRLQQVNKELTKFANVVQQSMTGPN